jgi:hypothetical protein
MSGRGENRYRSNNAAFETIASSVIKRAAPIMSRVFIRYALTAAMLHIVVLGVTVCELILVPWWTLYVRAILLVRLACLLAVVFGACCYCVGRPVRVAEMYGTGAPNKTARALSATPLLGAWLVLGYIDVGLRVLSVVADAVSVALPPAGQVAQAGLLRAAIGVPIVFEFHLTLNLIYQQGIRHNVERVLCINRGDDVHEV